MKYPVKWLKDYVDINVSPVELADALNLSGSHVEEVILTGDEISNVVTGKITKIERHPDAEKLVVCAVDINKEEEIQIVTAATNMKEQDIIPVALHGATLHGGLKIKKGKLRGVVSNGMFCSEEELGIAGDEPVHGLMILPKDTPIGVDIKSVIPLESAIIDFEITSNRADCFSIVGMARETAATLGLTYKMPNLKYNEEDKTSIVNNYSVEIKSPLCRRYMAKGISNINIQPSPQWMQERLLEAAVRPMIVLESANFNGLNIRNTSKKLGLRTEASTKFEKDLDPNLCKLAIDRVCALVEELGAGKVMTGVIDIYNEVKEPHTLEVDSNWVNRFLGSNISKEDMKKYLDGLDLTTEIKGDVLVVNCPTFRSDLNIKEDIAEEIARIHGYNNFESTLPHCEAIKSGKSDKHKLEDKIIEGLVASGINQSISYSFVSNKIFDKLLIPQDSELRNVVEIRNPLGEDFKIMRTTTLASMMESLARNYVKSNESAMLFEIGKVYIKNTDEEKLPEERNILTLGMYGAGDYLELKGVVENVLNSLGIDNGIFIRESENPSFHPGKTAALKLRNKISGVLGEIHPDVSENYGIDTRCFVAELNLDMLMECAKMDKKHKALPKFPAVTRDIAVLVDDRVLVQEIEDTIKKQGGGILESAKLFDVYKGSQIPEGKKSIAYAITYRHADKTLTDTEVNKVHDKILRSLEHKLGAELR